MWNTKLLMACQISLCKKKSFVRSFVRFGFCFCSDLLSCETKLLRANVLKMTNQSVIFHVSPQHTKHIILLLLLAKMKLYKNIREKKKRPYRIVVNENRIHFKVCQGWLVFDPCIAVCVCAPSHSRLLHILLLQRCGQTSSHTAFERHQRFHIDSSNHNIFIVCGGSHVASYCKYIWKHRTESKRQQHQNKNLAHEQNKIVYENCRINLFLP